MRIRSLFVTVFGIAIAGGSVYMAREFVVDSSTAAIAAVEPQTATVVVARSEVDFGVPIEPHMISVLEWPRESVPTGAFTSLSQVLPEAGGDPRRAKTKLFAGEVLLASKISNFGEKVTIVQKLGENTRAMAISVNASTAVGGFVTPGDFVDVVMTTGGGGGLRALTILQNIRIIGVDQQSEETLNQPDIARTVTVEVSPEQGQRLALAQQAGTLSLTLRTLDGVVDEPLDMVEMRDLLQERSPVEEEAEKKPRITVRRGTSTTQVDIN